MKNKRIVAFLSVSFFLLLPSFFLFASEERIIDLHFFEQRGCPDCARQKEFLEDIQIDYPELNVISYDITQRSSIEKLHLLAEEFEITDYRIMVPTTFVGDFFTQGFSERDKDSIIAAIEGREIIATNNLLDIPFIGERDIGDWSLPLTAFVLGSLDGLNVCSIGALILILMIVLSFKSRKKIFFYGGLFILTAVLIYGLLVFAWTALIEYFIGHLAVLSFIIGLASLGGGVFFFREFLNFYRFGPTCKSSGNKLAVKATERMQEAFNSSTKKGVLFLSGSVVMFAAIMTLVELPCSIALPVIFGGILASSGISFGGYVSYILLYLFFYMLVEIIIFAGAVVTKEIWIAESKAITWAYLAGSLVLFFLAFYYLIWLNFF